MPKGAKVTPLGFLKYTPSTTIFSKNIECIPNLTVKPNIWSYLPDLKKHELIFFIMEFTTHNIPGSKMMFKIKYSCYLTKEKMLQNLYHLSTIFVIVLLYWLFIL